MNVISHSKFNELYRQSGRNYTQSKREEILDWTNFILEILSSNVERLEQPVDKNELLFIFQDLKHTLDLTDVNLTVIDDDRR